MQRPTRILAVLFTVGVTAVGSLMAAPDDSPVTKINAEAATAEIETQSLRGGISVLRGSGGNIGVLQTPGGKLMVDAGIAVSRPRLESAVMALGPGPIRFLINTHWHWDHTDGNVWVQQAGAKVIAQENVLRRVSAPMRVEDWKFTFDPLPAAARPSIIVRDTKALKFGPEAIAIRHYQPSHTDGDVSVYFAKANVLFAGDTWWNGVYPFIDYVAGGSIDGMISAAHANIAMSNEQTIIVPGHGPVGDRNQLVEYRDMLVSIRKNIAELKQQGKSLDETIAAKPTAAYDAKWGNFVIDPAFFTRLVFRGV